MRSAFLVPAGLSLLLPVLTGAADLEGRVTRIENILNNQRGSDLLLQIQRLEAELQLLRGTVEQQQFDLEALQRQQKEQYLELDRRLSGQAHGGAPNRPAAPEASVERAAPASPGDPVRTPRRPPPADSAGGGAEAAHRAPDVASPTPGATAPASEAEAYRKAFDLLKQRRYDQALAAFNELLARYPNGEYVDNARYWLGETHYVRRDYPAALAEFRRVLDDYPLSPKAAGSMLKIGYIQDEQQDWPGARATLEGLMAKFPDSTEARLAKGRLERMAREGH